MHCRLRKRTVKETNTIDLKKLKSIQKEVETIKTQLHEQEQQQRVLEEQTALLEKISRFDVNLDIFEKKKHLAVYFGYVQDTVTTKPSYCNTRKKRR